MDTLDLPIKRGRKTRTKLTFMFQGKEHTTGTLAELPEAEIKEEQIRVNLQKFLNAYKRGEINRIPEKAVIKAMKTKRPDLFGLATAKEEFDEKFIAMQELINKLWKPTSVSFKEGLEK